MSKKGFLGGKNSNAYIVFYSTVMVIIVAVLLAFTSLSLKDRQEANELNEKKDAIVASMGLAKGTYDSVIDAYVVNKEGEVINTTATPLKKLFDLPASFAAGEYPVFENKTTGEVVLPLTGKGLWDDIWGYIALGADMNTIKGAIFDHAGETPGLGAEIATPKYQAQFQGQTIYEGEQLVGINVVKGGAQGAAHSVDAVTGGTKTSDGLENMIKECLKCYDAFFKSRTATPEAEVVETVNAE
ncbi:MAG: FMN-binding protein [Tidjanibacter sp.]|nr:FMN-binding protein [Tidjanibacter sp.]MBR1958061.1 FMN-binding protein [Tidjanibacter sp.]MBR3931559.1 FMN-binding protein [Tidjanibacter sp.]